MKKTITFNKNILFNSMIGEITSISLEHDLKFIDQNNIEGNFYITGTYKLTEASQIEESFNYKIPVDITLLENLDLKTTKIEIEDFKYNVKDEEELLYSIDVLIEGVEEIKDEERNCDGDLNNYEIKEDSNIKDIEPIKEETKEQEKQEEQEEQEENVKSLFSSFTDDDETYQTYSVYIIRNNETIESIMEKYKVNKEDLENYNDLSNIFIGQKIIIPNTNE